MPRYYFHLEDGQLVLDDTGLDLADIAAVQDEAFRAGVDLLKGTPRDHLWNGHPWRMWVTDRLKGEGKTFFTLRLSVEM